MIYMMDGDILSVFNIDGTETAVNILTWRSDEEYNTMLRGAHW